MKKFLLIAILPLVLINLLHAQKRFTSGGQLKPQQEIMDIRHYTIVLDVDLRQRSVDGYAIVNVIMTQPTHVVLLDLLDSLQVKQVLVNGKKASFEHKNDLIMIDPGDELPIGAAQIKVIYGGKPLVAKNPPFEDGFIWTGDSTGHPWMAITAEGIGGKLYFPCKDHPSDEPNEGVDMLITVPKDLFVGGPGLLKDVKKHGETATYHWKTNYTINNYSIIFNVGDYKVFSRPYTTVDGHQATVQFYVLNE